MTPHTVRTPDQEEILNWSNINNQIGGYCKTLADIHKDAFSNLKNFIIPDEIYEKLSETKRKEIEDNLQIISTDDPEKIQFLENVFADFTKSKQLYLVEACFKIEKIQRGYTANGRYVFGILGNWQAGHVNQLGKSPQNKEVCSVLVPGTRALVTIDSLPELLEMGIWDGEKHELVTKYTEFKTQEVEKIVEKTKVITQEKKVGVDKKQLEKAKAKVLHAWSKKWQPETVEAILNDFIKEL
jgi:hypothetical protein